MPILRVSSLTFVLTGVTTTARALLQRHLRFRTVGVIEVVSYAFLFAPLAVALAAAGFGAWSLVLAGLGQLALTAALMNVAARPSMRPLLSRAVLKALFSFGARVSGISFLEFLSSNLVPLWIGNRLGAAALGIFNRAYNLMFMPTYYFTTSLSRVMYSSMSRVQTDRAKLRGVYLSLTTVLAALLMPVCWGAAGAAREIVLVLLGPRWTDAIPVFAVLALATPLSFMTHLSGVVSEVTAQLNPKMALTAAKLGVLVLLLVALSPFGLVGCAAAFAGSELFVYAGYHLLMRTALAAPVKGLLVRQLPGYVMGVAALAVTSAVGWLGTAGGLSVWLILAVQLLLGAALLLWTVLRSFSGGVWAALHSGLRWEDRLRPDTRSGRLMLWLDARAATTPTGAGPSAS